MNYFKILFLLLLFTSGVFANKNELIKPKNNQSIIDIGYKNPQSKYEVSVSPDWQYYSTLIRDVDKLVQAKNRVLSEKYDCETDYLGRENCSVNQVTCNAQLQQSDGFATKINKTRKLSPTPKKVAKNSCSANNYTGCYNTELYFIQGCPWGYRVQANWYGCGKSASRHPHHWRDYGYFGDDWAAVQNIVNTFGRTGREITYKPYSTCLDYDTYSYTCPTDYKIKEVSKGNFICEKEYSYYEYKCGDDTNYYDRPWRGPVIDSGIDCNANCGPYGCICNSATPPKNNCVRDTYECPFDKNQDCTITTDDKGPSETIINGYIYDAGISETYFSFIEKDKNCIGGYKWDSKSNICISNTEYTCLQQGFSYDKIKDSCIGEMICSGEIINGKCVEDAKAECPTGYSYNKLKYRCESNPVCDSGVYNTNSNLCEANASTLCPVGFYYSTSNKRCEKTIKIEKFSCNSNEILKNGTPNYCLSKKEISTPSYTGSVSRSWYVSPLSLTNDLAGLKKSLSDIADIGNGSLTFSKSGNNYLVGNTSKKPFSISLSSGGSLTVPANTSFTVLPNGFQVGASVITASNAMATFTISKSCGSWIDVPAAEDTPSYKICSDTELKYASCPTGYSLENQTCIKNAICGENSILTTNKQQCIRNLSCPAGYLADYSKNGCVKVEGGYELSLGENIYINDLFCLGGISEKGICATAPTCNKEGKLDLENDRCVLLAQYILPNDKIAKCESGYYYQDEKCLAIPVCQVGIFDVKTKSCTSLPSCPTGFFLDNGKCLQQVETVAYNCLSTESLYKGVEKDVCRIEKVAGVCKTGYTESLNASYCERDVICPTGYSVDNKNRTCVKGE